VASAPRSRLSRCSDSISTKPGNSRSAMGFRSGSGQGARLSEVFPKTTWIVQPWWMGHAERMNFMPRSTSFVADVLQGWGAKSVSADSG
jgi:hypothetical protein